MECAVADRVPSSWVCSVHVRDADRVRAALAGRGFGQHAAAWLPFAAAELARDLPTFAGATPVALDHVLAPTAVASGRGELAFAERARTEINVDGVVFERYAAIRRREGAPTEIDAEHYLFMGDRLVVFGDEETARAVVGRPPAAARSLERSARFRRATAGWADGASLQIATVDWRGPSDVPLVDRRDATIELVPDGTTLAVTMRAPGASAGRGVGSLTALLPDAPLSRFALAPSAGRAPRGRAPAIALRSAADVGRLAIREAERIAFAWMPGAADAPWDRWIAIGDGARLDRALAASGIAPPAEGDVAQHAGVRIARRGRRWVIGPSEDDVRAALARADAPDDPRATAIGSGGLDGAAAAPVIRAQAAVLPAGDPRRASLEALARIAAAGRAFSLDVRREGRELVVVARVAPSP
jgi:hypothetical protein